MRRCHQGYVLDDDRARFDFERCHAWLTAAYWSPGITRTEVEQGFRHSSFTAGAYRGREQVGCLRLVTDFTRFAYFMDVYVSETERGRGLGRALVRFALEHPRLSLVSKWTLATADAHGVYRGVGFHELPEPGRWMALARRRDWLPDPP
ncbi:MAG TPA: GNAT family N-acetyltransferase [Polyangiaceae bacterium]|nr:GNAT family N-acetyltransferase [Polyangiaceae bacterium]